MFFLQSFAGKNHSKPIDNKVSQQATEQIHNTQKVLVIKQTSNVGMKTLAGVTQISTFTPSISLLVLTFGLRDV